MANYKHGVYISETGTSLIPTVRVESALPFVVGTAPINQIEAGSRKINEPVLINSYAEAVKYFGFEAAQVFNAKGDKKFAHGLCEFMYANFNFYGIVPCIFVNVLDPSVHKAAVEAQTVTIKDGSGTLNILGVLAETLVVTNGQTGDDLVTYVAGTDYETAFDENGYLVINWIGSALPSDVSVSGYKIDPSLVTKADIIGGIDSTTGKRKGLELMNEVYPKFSLVPTLILAPGFSSDPEVAAIMAAKAVIVNGNFRAMALCDAPANEGVQVYSSVPQWKKNNNLVLTQQILCWPMVRNTETLYHASVHLAGVIGVTDNAYGGVPYCSPSNKNASITGLCLEDGSEVVFGNEEANYLNGQGIITILNFAKGWTFWGNRTCCYPGNTDPKDAFIPVRRMFQWVGNTIILTIFQKVDEPGNRRLIETIVNSLNVWLNSLVARQQLLGARVLFREEDNPTTELMDGIYHFKVFMTPPSPAEDLEFNLEIDTGYYDTLFG